MTQRSLPTRTLSTRPNLDQLKRQAKELLEAFRTGDASAVKEVNAHYRRADPATFALHDAQLVLARAYGFESWPKLKAFVDGVTVRRLIDAVRADDLQAVVSMVAARPELVHLDTAENDEHRALHHAVLQRRPAIVRFLMQQGSDARNGIWPHRAATTAFTLAAERGYSEIVAIIEAEEKRRAVESSGESPSPGAETRQPDEEADAARAAIDRGDAAWLRARHADGRLSSGHGLLSHAVEAGRSDILAVLLDLGLDPDEAGRVGGLEEVVETWGEPLRASAIKSDLAAAESLLARGANANTNVYAASSAMYEACRKGDQPMIALLERHGGHLSAVAVAELGLVDHAARLLADAAAGRTLAGTTGPHSTVAYDLLWGAIESSSPEIVRLALGAVDWPPSDSQWHGILENGLYVNADTDRVRHLEGFSLILDRCDPNVRSGRGTTILHEIAASRGGLTAEDRVVYSTLLLDRGARVDLRDHLLQSTPLGWACRWGRVEMVQLLLARGADPVEQDAPSWASPAAWAEKMGRPEVAVALAGSAKSGT